MVEVLRNIEEVYKKWEKKANPQLQPEKSRNHGRSSFHQNNDLPLSRKYRPSGQLNKYDVSDTFASFKTNPSLLSLPKNKLEVYNRTLIGYSCGKCAPSSQGSLVDDVCKNLGLKNIFKVPEQNSDKNLLVRKFAHIFHVFNRKHFNYDRPTKEILQCERVLEGISKDVEQDPNSSIDHESQASISFDQLCSTISASCLRFASWFLLKVLSRIFKSIQVHEGQLEVLRRTEKFSKPVVYLPLHRSHLDYVLITLVLYLNDIRAPLIAAGDNLRLPILRWILSSLGGFFIKRKLDRSPEKKDHTYRSVLHSYVVESLKQGNSLEFFIEGGRTRSGKVCQPKAGLLSIIIDAYAQGDIEDVYIVPVGVSFEKLVEGSFVSEQLGHKKKKETLRNTLANIWNSLKQSYGSVRVDFGEPFILSEYMESIRRCLPSTPTYSASCMNASIMKTGSMVSLYSLDAADKDEYRNLVNNVAQHIVYDASQFSCIMSTNIIAFLLLTRHRQGTDLDSLLLDFTKLRDDLSHKKRNVNFIGCDQDVVLYACNILGSECVQISENQSSQCFIKPHSNIEAILELSYYGAPLVSVYFCQSIVANAVSVMSKVDLESLTDCEAQLSISRDELFECALSLCNVFKFEHIFCPPCRDLGSVISETIEDFVTEELLHDTSSNYCSEDRKRGSEMSSYWETEDGDDIIWGNPTLNVNLDSNSVEKLCFFRNILSPYVESYWVTCVQLYKLLQTEMEESAFLKSAQNDIRSRLDQGLLFYQESIALESVKNCLKLLEYWGVIESFREGNVKLLYLSSDYKKSEKIGTIILTIQHFKR